MIGLPFANRGSVELIEKMKYANECSVSKQSLIEKWNTPLNKI